MSYRFVFVGALLALLAVNGIRAGDNRSQQGAVDQRGGPVSQNVKLPALRVDQCAMRAGP